MRSYPRTLLNETYHAVISRHIEYAKAAGMPWGISESAYNVQDAGGELSISRVRRARHRIEARPRRRSRRCAVRLPARRAASAEGSHRQSRASRIGRRAGADGLLRGHRLHEGAPRSRAAPRDRAHLHGAPSRHEPGGAEQLPERQHHAVALPRRSARAGRRAAAAGAQPASGAARPSARRAQGRGDAGPRRAVARAQVCHAAHGHAARASAVERIVERHADERRRRLHALARRRGHALARGLHVRRVGHVLLRARSHVVEDGGERTFWSVGVSAERPRRRQLRGDICARSRRSSAGATARSRRSPRSRSRPKTTRRSAASRSRITRAASARSS